MGRWLALVLLACAGCEQILGIADPRGGLVVVDARPNGDAIGPPGTDAATACATGPTFGMAQNFSAAGATDVAAGDLDGNGTPDVVVAVGTDVMVFKGDGAGHLSGGMPLTNTPIPATGVLVVDVDNDGLADVVSWSRGGPGVAGGQPIPPSNDVTVRRQNPASHGQFLAAQTVATGATVVGILAADLNQDQRPDLVVGNQTSITAYFSDPMTNGKLIVGPVLVSPISNPVGVLDIDGDMLPDVAVSDATGVHVRYNRPSSPGTFDPPATIGTTSSGALFGHFSANTGRDLNIFGTNGGAALFVQGPPRAFTEAAASAIAIGGQPSTGYTGIIAADVNHDGTEDVITVGQVSLQCTAPFGRFAPPQALGTVAMTQDVQLLVDLNADGKLDLLQIASGAATSAQFVQVAIQP